MLYDKCVYDGIMRLPTSNRLCENTLASCHPWNDVIDLIYCHYRTILRVGVKHQNKGVRCVWSTTNQFVHLIPGIYVGTSLLHENNSINKFLDCNSCKVMIYYFSQINKYFVFFDFRCFIEV